jgi:putative MATE family efflux protein
MNASKHAIDMCRGPLLGKLFRYAVPLWLTGLMQIAFHGADMAVIGRFGSDKSMAAIGAVGELSWLLICVVVGVSAGSNVLAAQMFGAGDRKGLRRTVHTSIAFALASGIVLTVLGQLLLAPALRWLNVPEELRPLSLKYLRICFSRFPVMMIGCFSYSIMRGVGDSRRPLYFLLAASGVNLALNVVFVKFLHMDVGGVAAATVISEIVSAGLSVTALLRERGAARLVPKCVRFYPAELKRMLWIGVPSGVQYACYALANTIIQSAINTLDTVSIAGNTSAVIVEMLLHTWSSACFLTVMTAVGQNFGAGDCRRAVRSILLCLLIVTVSMTALGLLAVLNGEFLLGLIKADPAVVARGMVRIRTNLGVYALLAVMDILSGALRGFGRSVTPMVATLVGACGLRVVWVYTVFRSSPTLWTLYAVFPLSWICVSLVNGAILFFVCRALLAGNGKSLVLKLVR